MGRQSRLQKMDKMHVLIDVGTNEIMVYLTTDKIGDNTTFRMLTYIALTKGHIFDMIYVDSTYEAKENWKDSVKQDYMLIVKFKSDCNKKSNDCMQRRYRQVVPGHVLK